MVGGAFDPEDSGKLTCQAGHPAFLPASTTRGDGLRQSTDEAGAIRGEDGHDDRCMHVDSQALQGQGRQFFFGKPSKYLRKIDH